MKVKYNHNPILVIKFFFSEQVTIMFVTLEKIAQVEPKYVDIVLLENYAAFQHRFILFLILFVLLFQV